MPPRREEPEIEIWLAGDGFVIAVALMRELPRADTVAEEKDDANEQLYGLFNDWESSFNRLLAPVSEKRGCDRDSNSRNSREANDRSILMSGPEDT